MTTTEAGRRRRFSAGRLSPDRLRPTRLRRVRPLPDSPAAPATSDASVPFLTCAFGGGGAFGVAYALGITEVLGDAGVPVGTSSALGTSAGSWVASCLAGGIPFTAVAELPPLRVPNLRTGALQELSTQLLGDLRSPQVRAVAFRLSNGQRTILSGNEHRLADIVAASSAVPWLFAPAVVDGHRYVDGGVRSLVSADLAPAAEHLLVIAPIAGPMFGRAGKVMEVVLRRELRGWQQATGGRAHLIRPNRAIADLARTPRDLFDPDLARAVHPLARAQAERLLMTRPGIAGLAPAAGSGLLTGAELGTASRTVA